MICQEKYKCALSALQIILTRARFMAGTGIEPSKIVRLLDEAERLPELIGCDQDKTETFRAMLVDIVYAFPICRPALEIFDTNSNLLR